MFKNLMLLLLAGLLGCSSQPPPPETALTIDASSQAKFEESRDQMKVGLSDVELARFKAGFGQLMFGTTDPTEIGLLLLPHHDKSEAERDEMILRLAQANLHGRSLEEILAKAEPE
jgi:hypothetical protein